MSQNKWDARGYADNARFVSDLGMPVVELLAPLAGEEILDLGCGDGVLTAKLAAMGVIVQGLDQSNSMVEAALRLGLQARQGDMHNFQLGRKFDAVFTNAVLHWTKDIDSVLRCVANHLEEGGRFVGEFGGFGNVAAIVTAMRSALLIEGAQASTFSWYYPTPQEFSTRLEAHGFEVKSAQLIPRPTPLPTGMSGWLATFGTPLISKLQSKHGQRVIDRAVQLLSGSLKDSEGNWIADYVRLRFHAVLRPGAHA